MRFTTEMFERSFRDTGRLLVLTGTNRKGRKEALRFLTHPSHGKGKFPLKGRYTEWYASGGEHVPTLWLRDEILSWDFFVGQSGDIERFVLRDTSPKQETWLWEHGAIILRIEDAKAKGGPARPGEWVVPWKGTRKFARTMRKILKTQKYA
ncbi:hypothetical protein ABT332_06615 [Saccharomonospora azurea]|uniref:hypothetical protein n=1 Tax=Saccharomonospora azurea TaxID=40988 RepID=UPI0033205148